MAERSRGRRARVRVARYKDRPHGLRWSADGHSGEISSGELLYTKALVAAGLLLAELERGVLPTDGPTSTCWAVFRRMYEDQGLSQLSEASQGQWRTAVNWVEKILDPKSLHDFDKQSIRKLRDLLLAEGLSPASVRSYLATLRAGLAWACDEADLIDDVPRFKMPKTVGTSNMRSRPITLEEFERILSVVPKVRKHDADDWTRFLKGLWLSGLRVDELRRLSWEPSAKLCVVTHTEYPLVRILLGGQKAKREEFAPITKAFWDLISEGEGTGYVLPLRGRKGQMIRSHVIRVIAEIGRRAGVVTDATKGKTATSHDIGKRAYITRMDGTLTGPELQKAARHASIETTMSYYHHKTAIELAAKIWE